jgi:hypothetical protein
MKRSFLILVVLMTCLGLAACAAGPRKQWVHAERSAAEMAQDKSSCDLQAESGARNILGAIEENRKAELFRQCMEDRGYRLEPVAPQP